jgi:hypothetical protein
MILLKARESAPKKGYYYRSWMSIVQCVQLGKDLGLDEHFAEHQAGKTCGASQAECGLKTRIWQTLFVVELMVGSPQGKYLHERGGHEGWENHTTDERGQDGPTSRSKKTLSISTSQGYCRTATSLSTSSPGTSPISPELSAQSAGWRGPMGG